MLKTLRKINRRILDVIAYGDGTNEKIYDTINVISHSLNVNVYIINEDFKEITSSTSKSDKDFFEQFASYQVQMENILVEGVYYTISPLISSNKVLGYLIFSREKILSEEEIIIFESYKILATISLFNILRDKNFKKQREINIVKNSIASFSYSELHAISAIFNELGGSEGIVVASYVSSKYSVTRSVIVSALRKFESSNVIESRSLGAKGTYIKVLNPYLLDELEPIKNDFLNK